MKTRRSKPQHKPYRILVIDVGGTHVKLLMTGQKDPVKIPSGLSMTAAKMVRVVKKATRSWKYDAIAMGYPGPVINGHPLREPAGFNVTLPVDDVDAWYDRAIKAGCTAVMTPADMFWGDRYGQLKDPFGVLWAINGPIKK